MCWKISFSFIKIQEELCSNFAELVETERATNKNVKRRRGAKKKKGEREVAVERVEMPPRAVPPNTFSLSHVTRMISQDAGEAWADIAPYKWIVVPLVVVHLLAFLLYVVLAGSEGATAAPSSDKVQRKRD